MKPGRRGAVASPIARAASHSHQGTRQRAMHSHRAAAPQREPAMRNKPPPPPPPRRAPATGGPRARARIAASSAFHAAGIDAEPFHGASHPLAASWTALFRGAHGGGGTGGAAPQAGIAGIDNGRFTEHRRRRPAVARRAPIAARLVGRVSPRRLPAARAPPRRSLRDASAPPPPLAHAAADAAAAADDAPRRLGPRRGRPPPRAAAAAPTNRRALRAPPRDDAPSGPPSGCPRLDAPCGPVQCPPCRCPVSMPHADAPCRCPV